MKILLVEDNPLNIRLFYDTLTMKGYEVVVAMNGNEALNVLKTILPDIIILDLYMPGMSGFRFANTISKDLKYSKIPIIVVSASSSVYDVKEMASYNIKAYLVKPVSPTKLLETVKKIIIEEELKDVPSYVSKLNKDTTTTTQSSISSVSDSSNQGSFENSSVKKELETGIKVSVDDLVEGMVLGAPILKNKAVIYKEGFVLDDKSIEKIKSLGIREVYLTRESFENFRDIIGIKNDTENLNFDPFKEFDE
ncbi:MAG: response regulator [Brevinematales bacterium]|nr:response regulator [Brevinematales bacterium]